MSSHNHTQKSVQSPVTFPAAIIAQDVLPRACAVPQTDGPSGSLRMGEHSTHRKEDFDGPRGSCQATTDKLPDDVLLEIFDFYLDDEYIHGRRRNVDEWHTLVHVCRRWRNVVFASPRRLDLRLLCRKDRPVRAMLDIWPALPINIEGFWRRWRETGTGQDNIFPALEHPDRVRSITILRVPGPQGELLTAAMQVRFPELTELRFSSWDVGGPVLPNTFLGGSAPRLRSLWLTNVPFPAAPNLLLSARDLVYLRLDDIPHSGYIPPSSMVACLSSLNKLKFLSLRFASPQSRPDRPISPPQSRVALPALIRLVFYGMSKYSEDLVAHIDTPVLNQLDMTFFWDPIFDLRHLKEFIGRAKGLKPSKAAELRVSSSSIHLDLQEPRSSSMGVKCDEIDLPPESPPGNGVMVSTQFLDIFRLVIATRSLYVPESSGPVIASVLQELITARSKMDDLRLLYVSCGLPRFDS